MLICLITGAYIQKMEGKYHGPFGERLRFCKRWYFFEKLCEQKFPYIFEGVCLGLNKTKGLLVRESNRHTFH